MFWYILLGICVLLLPLFIVLLIKGNDKCGIGIICCGSIMPILVSAMIMQPLTYKKEIALFESTKQYIEEVVPTLPETYNYAITNSRIEMNKWLYEIQYRYQNYHFWNFVPKEVMELEEIK